MEDSQQVIVNTSYIGRLPLMTTLYAACVLIKLPFVGDQKVISPKYLRISGLTKKSLLKAAPLQLLLLIVITELYTGTGKQRFWFQYVFLPKVPRHSFYRALWFR